LFSAIIESSETPMIFSAPAAKSIETGERVSTAPWLIKGSMLSPINVNKLPAVGLTMTSLF
jgi:hypothetical protein